MEGRFYKENFCEENVWHLGSFLSLTRDSADFDVLFLAGVQGHIPVFCQKKGTLRRPVWWDYHVILFDKKEKLIFDFDTRLGFPCALQEYIDATFEPGKVFEEKWQPMVRSVPLKTYLERFHSDRSHMFDQKGRELSPFPDWPPIMALENPLKLVDLCETGKKIKDLGDFFPWNLLRNAG